jgi:nucleoside-diphosphate-sugar epimerase
MNPVMLPPTLIERLRSSHWRILVTGASGWLGQASLELLTQSLGSTWRERVFAFGSSERNWTLRDGTEVRQQPLAALPTLPRRPSLLLHFAYLTREKASTMPTENYIATNRALSQLAAEAGATVGVERVFVTSSGAVHAALAEPDNPAPPLLYGKLKLEDEALFEHFALSAPERRAFVARLFNLSGPYINKLDSYALASFIRQARQGRIEIRARHPVVRSYTSAENLLGAAFGQLLTDDGKSFVRVETAGDCEVEMSGLAQVVRTVVAPHAVIERTSLTTEAADCYVGDGANYRQLLAEHGITEHTLARQIADTAEYLESFQEDERQA